MSSEKLQFNFALRWEQEQAKNHEQKRKKNQTLVWGFVVLIFLVFLGSMPWVWEYKLRLDLAKVNQQISEVGSIDQDVRRLNSLKNQIEKQKQVLELSHSTRDPNAVLDKLKNILPVGTRVNSLALSADNLLVMNVTVSGPVDVAKLWKSLEDSKMFKNVDIQTVSLLDQVQTLNLSLVMK
jgi:Tfp pilus assembly protein PilN